MFIRKSMLESYDFCPQSFFKVWIMNYSKGANYKMLVGTRFHDFAEKFFDYAGVFDPSVWEDFIPTEDFNEEEVEMATWFINYQRERYAKLQLENRLDEFAPIYKELFMKCDATELQSTMDGAFWVNKQLGTVALMEYKTGSKMQEDSAFRQLSFYAELWEQSGNPGVVTELWLINPRLKAHAEVPYTLGLKEAAKKRVQKLRDAIDKSYFPYICTDGKFAACKLCSMEELPKLFKDDGMTRFSDIYGGEGSYE